MALVRDLTLLYRLPIGGSVSSLSAIWTSRGRCFEMLQELVVDIVYRCIDDKRVHSQFPPTKS
jgi:hypothetical protein